MSIAGHLTEDMLDQKVTKPGRLSKRATDCIGQGGLVIAQKLEDGFYGSSVQTRLGQSVRKAISEHGTVCGASCEIGPSK
jgi:hypothetical protein